MRRSLKALGAAFTTGAISLSLSSPAASAALTAESAPTMSITAEAGEPGPTPPAEFTDVEGPESARAAYETAAARTCASAPARLRKLVQNRINHNVLKRAYQLLRADDAYDKHFSDVYLNPKTGIKEIRWRSKGIIGEGMAWNALRVIGQSDIKGQSYIYKSGKADTRRRYDLRSSDGGQKTIFWEVKVNTSDLTSSQESIDDSNRRAGYFIGDIWLMVSDRNGEPIIGCSNFGGRLATG